MNSGLAEVRVLPTAPLDDLPDRELWERVSSGDEHAFTQLFRRHLKAVWNYAHRLTGSADTAEDITSATFLTAWRRRTSVVLVRDSVLPWLYTVASNLVRDEHKSSQRRLRLVGRLGRTLTVVPDHADATVGRLDGFRQVVAAIRTLPTAQRRAAELCLLGEVSQQDAAVILGVAEVTLRSTLSRAKARLREIVPALEVRP